MKSLTTRLEPAELEREFRLWEWAPTLRRARLAIIVASAVFLLFVYPDFLFFGVRWPFAGLFMLRLSVVVLGAAALWALAGPPRPERFDRLVFVWTAWCSVLAAVILPASRPQAWLQHGFIVCTAIPAIYTLVPTTFSGGTVIGLGMGAGYLTFVVLTNAELTYVQGAVLGVALLAANAFGAATSRWLHGAQRANFLKERSLRQAEESLNALVDAVPFPMALLDRGDGRLRRSNDAARALFATASEGGAERAIAELAARVPELVAAGTRELPWHGPGGERWLLLSARPITHEGEPCALLSFVDITARKEAEEALASAKRDADAASRAKSTFLASMSHEIRTPLHGVLAAVQLLERARLDGGEREHVETIRFCARGMLELVDGILDLSRAEAGMLAPARAAYDLRAAVRATRESVVARAATRELRLELDPALPATLIGDEARVRRVLLNLIDNALKYGDASPIDIAAKADGGVVRVSVENGGAPIPPAARASIFDAFVQLDGSGRGFGLGLSICRRDVAAMGGSLQLEDTPAGRTRFAFSLPLVPGPASLPAPSATRPRATRPLSLLLAEDDAVSGRLALALLSGAGHRVTLVTRGDDAVTAASRERFDAILMDMRLPGLDGLAATRQIRALPGGAEVPIIATTANAMNEERARYLAAGVSLVFPKPIDFAALDAVLAGAAGTPPWIDTSLLARYGRALGDGPARDLLALCVEAGKPLVDAIAQAVREGDAAQVARHAHALASAAHSAAFMRLGAAAGELEDCALKNGAGLADSAQRLSEAWQGTLVAYQRELSRRE